MLMNNPSEKIVVLPEKHEDRWLPPDLHLHDWRQAAAAPIFNSIPSEVIMEALKSGNLCCFAKNREVFSPECRPSSFLLILKGRIKLYCLDANGEERGLRFAGPGELLCPPLNQEGGTTPLCTFAEAAESLRVLFLPSCCFLRLLHDHFGLARNLITQLALSLERAGHQACLRKARSAPVLVARYLLENTHENSMVIDVRPVRMTAQELGIARETLSRAITGLHKRRLIDYCRGRVQVVDRPGLQKIASCL
jgi:CRP-like cAMP-binding protein